MLGEQRKVVGKGVQALTRDKEGHLGEALNRTLSGGRSGE